MRNRHASGKQLADLTAVPFTPITTSRSPSWRGAALRRLIPFAFAACAGTTLAAPAAAPAGTQAAVLFHNYCSVCHGDKGDGNSRAAGALSTPPRDFTSAASKRELSPERIALAITHGRPGTAMVGWKSQLSGADIAALADHVYTRFVQGVGATDAAATAAAISGTHAHGGRGTAVAAAPAAADMSLALPNGLKGDARRGERFYLANCVACHGTKGDGAGPRAYFINPKPRNFIEPASRARFNRLALYAAISEGRNGSEMPAWRQVASPQQIGDVAEYVFQAFVAAPPAGARAAKP